MPGTATSGLRLATLGFADMSKGATRGCDSATSMSALAIPRATQKRP